MEVRQQLMQAQQQSQYHPVDIPVKPASTFNLIGEHRRRLPFKSFNSGTAIEARKGLIVLNNLASTACSRKIICWMS
jgi:hypothetical protein